MPRMNTDGGIPEQLNIADWFLGDRLREGRGERVAIRTDAETFTYAQVEARANQYGNCLQAVGVKAEQRVIIALEDSLDWVAAFFGTLKIGAVVVMVNPQLKAEAMGYFLNYTRATAALVGDGAQVEFGKAAAEAPHLERVLEVGSEELEEDLSPTPSSPGDRWPCWCVAPDRQPNCSTRFVRQSPTPMPGRRPTTS